MPIQHPVLAAACPRTTMPRRLCLAMALGVALVLGGCASRGPETSAASHAGRYRADHGDPIGALLLYRGLGTGSGGTLAANAQVAEVAQNYLGVKYRWGGSSPETGFDCSGLVGFVMEQSLGLRLPRRSAEMAELGVKIGRDELQPGDLVFFNTLGQRYSHVGIYMGDDRFVHSPSSGGVVRIENMTLAYWAKRYNGARRMVATTVASASHWQ